MPVMAVSSSTENIVITVIIVTEKLLANIVLIYTIVHVETIIPCATYISNPIHSRKLQIPIVRFEKLSGQFLLSEN